MERTISSTSVASGNSTSRSMPYLLRTASMASYVSFGRRPVSSVKNLNLGLICTIMSVTAASSAPKLDALATRGWRLSEAHRRASSAVRMVELRPSTCACVRLVNGLAATVFVICICQIVKGI